MAIDFEQEYGVNAGYVQELFEDWKSDPGAVEESWRKIFERAGDAAPSSRETRAKGNGAASAASAGDSDFDPKSDPELELLAGISGRIAENMEASLDLPVA
ncbi:MAG: hypothetical protein AAGA20_23825, partial [Planctomycetota bacterium]